MASSPAFAIAGNESAGGGQIGQGHIDLAIPFGNTVAFIGYGNGTATGTFVPSATQGQLKFLTAAHNVDFNNDGVLDAGNAPLTFYFGGAPGLDGSNATYRVVVQPANIRVKQNWASSGGSATNDLAVLTFSASDIVIVKGGAKPTTAPVFNQTPVGKEGLAIGYGLSGDGTVPLDGNDPNLPAVNQVDGILKAGWNKVGGVGVPGTNGLPQAGGTVSPGSGTVVLTDFDRSTNNGAGQDPATSSFNDTLPANKQRLEGGTASGDSGSPFLVDSNGDGIYEVAGVLNGGDNPIPGQGVSQFGDLSQYAPIFTAENIAFLQQAGVYLGTEYRGVTINGQMVIVDTTILGAIVAPNPIASQALAEQVNMLRRMGDKAIEVVQQRSLKALQGLSVLNDKTGTRVAEIYFAGSLSFADGIDDNIETPTGQLGIDIKLNKNLLVGGAVGNGNVNGNFGSNWTSGTAYAIGSFNGYILTTGASFSDHDLDSLFRGSKLTASADVLAFAVSLASQIDVGAFMISPSVGGRYTYGWIHGGSITTNGTTSGLPDHQYDQYRVQGGLTASYHIDYSWGMIVPYAGAQVGYRDSTVGNSVTAAGIGQAAVQPFFGLQASGNTFTLVNLPISIGGGAAAAPAVTTQTNGGSAYSDVYGGITFQLTNGPSISFAGSGRFDDEEGNTYGASLGVGMAF